MPVLLNKIIKLLFFITFLFIIIVSYFKVQDSRIDYNKKQRNYPSEVYNEANSFAQYLIYAEFEVLTKRNIRLEKIINNFNGIDQETSESNKKRKDMLKKQVGGSNYSRLKIAVSNLKLIKEKKKTQFEYFDYWDLYFFEKSLVFDYLENLQAPVLDNPFLKGFKNE